MRAIAKLRFICTIFLYDKKCERERKVSPSSSRTRSSPLDQEIENRIYLSIYSTLRFQARLSKNETVSSSNFAKTLDASIRITLDKD